jgi:hypothetical protein
MFIYKIRDIDTNVHGTITPKTAVYFYVTAEAVVWPPWTAEPNGRKNKILNKKCEFCTEKIVGCRNKIIVNSLNNLTL